MKISNLLISFRAETSSNKRYRRKKGNSMKQQTREYETCWKKMFWNKRTKRRNNWKYLRSNTVDQQNPSLKIQNRGE